MFCSMICLSFILFAFFPEREMIMESTSIWYRFHCHFTGSFVCVYEISTLRSYFHYWYYSGSFIDVLSFACKFFSFVFNYLSYRKLILCFMQLNYYYYYIWIDSDKKEEFLSFFNVTIYIINTLIILKLNLWLRRCRSYRHFHFRDI